MKIFNRQERDRSSRSLIYARFNFGNVQAMLCVDAKYRERFKQLGLTSTESIVHRFWDPNLQRTTMVLVKADSIQLPGGPIVEIFYKQYEYRKPFWKFLLRASKARREFQNYEALGKLGIRTADRIACGEQRDWLGRVRRAFIITRAIANASTLEEFVEKNCRDRKNPDVKILRAKLLDQLAAMTRQIHSADFFHHDLVWRNILVTWSPPAEPQLWWIDCPRGTFDRWSPWRYQRKLKDLAWLDKIASRLCAKSERVKFVKRYLGRNRLDSEAKKLIRDVSSFGKSEEGLPGENRFRTINKGRLIVAQDFLPLLQLNNLDEFNNVRAFAGGNVMRSVPGRSTVQIELKQPGHKTTVAYLKRYEREYLSTGKKLLRFLRWPGADDEAMHEWKSIHALRAKGFNTARPIMVGQKKTGGIVTRSFLLTAEIPGGVAAHDYMRGLGTDARRKLIFQIAELTRRFHAAGFVHKDYYLSHIFVANSQLFHIDLQRVIRPQFFRKRWIAKDLAALGYSAQRSGASRSDLTRFYKARFEKKRLNAADKRFIRQIMQRVNALHQRGPKYDVIWDQPGVHPPNV